MIHADQNKLEQAVANLDHAIRLEPRFTLAYLNRGVLLRRLSQAERAETDLATAHQLEPDLAIPPP